MFDRIREVLMPPRKESRQLAQPAASRTEKWDQEVFVERFLELIDERKGEEALDYVLSQVGELASSDIHRRSKLSHLRYATRIIEGRTSAKHGPNKLRRKVGLLKRHLESVGEPPRGTFLDFGCGRHDPLGLATVAYANGYERAIACDMQGVEIPAYSAQSMYEILLEIFRWPGRFRFPGVEDRTIRQRIAKIKPGPFANHDFAQGVEEMKGKVDYRLDELGALDVQADELGFAVSFAVLEHVEDAAEIYRWLYSKARPGSAQYHYIDLADHRAYGSKNDHDFWSFLTQETAPANANRLRAYEHLALIREAGFEILRENRDVEPIPDGTRARLLPPWRDLPTDEIESIGIRLLIRKPD